MEPKKRGRPSIASSGATGASTVLPIDLYDHICKCALAHETSVSAVMRDGLLLAKDTSELVQFANEVVQSMADGCRMAARNIRAGIVSATLAELLEVLAERETLLRNPDCRSTRVRLRPILDIH